MTVASLCPDCVANMYMEVIYGTWPTEQPAHMPISDRLGWEVVVFRPDDSELYLVYNTPPTALYNTMSPVASFTNMV